MGLRRTPTGGKVPPPVPPQAFSSAPFFGAVGGAVSLPKNNEEKILNFS